MSPAAVSEPDALPVTRSLPPTVLVTRPARQAQHWAARLREAGQPAEVLPLLAIGPAPDPARVRAVHAALTAGDLVMFVSPNAAIEYLACLPTGTPWPAGVTAAATGPGTVRALSLAGVPHDALVAPAADAPQFDSEALWLALSQAAQPTWVGRRVWVVRGEGGRDWFAEHARTAGAQVQFVQSYRRQAAAWTAQEQALAAQVATTPEAWVWLLSSSEALGHLAHLMPAADWARHQALVTHPRIAEQARALGWGHLREVKPTVEAVAQALRLP